MIFTCEEKDNFRSILYTRNHWIATVWDLLGISVASTSSNSQWNSPGLEPKVVEMASLQSKGWTFSRDCMAVSFELSSNQSGFPHFSILYRWWKILHDLLVLWVHLMMLLANVTHLRLSLSTTAISMWPKEAQGSAKRNVPTRRRASIFGSLAEDQQFLMIEGSGVSFVDIFKMPEAHRNSFSGWDGWNRYIVDKLQMKGRLWMGLIIFNQRLQQLDDWRRWILGATAQVLWSSSITWSGCSRCTDGWDWCHFRIFSLDLWLVFLVSDLAICYLTILTRSPMSCVQCCVDPKNKPWLSPSIAGHQNKQCSRARTACLKPLWLQVW